MQENNNNKINIEDLERDFSQIDAEAERMDRNTRLISSIAITVGGNVTSINHYWF